MHESRKKLHVHVCIKEQATWPPEGCKCTSAAASRGGLTAEPRSRADLSGEEGSSGRPPLKLGVLEACAVPVGLAGLPFRASSRLLMLPCRECVGGAGLPWFSCWILDRSMLPPSRDAMTPCEGWAHPQDSSKTIDQSSSLADP